MNNDDLFDGIDTDRIHLRCVRPSDAVVVAQLMTPSVSRWLASWPETVTEAFVAARILEARAAVADGQALHFLIARRTDRAVMGWIRVSRVEADPKRGDLGYWLSDAYHSHGYMPEAAHAALTAAFDRLGLDSIEGGAQPENVASLSVMRRLGMEYSDERVVWASARGRDEPCVFYSVTREMFTQHRLGRNETSKYA